MFVTFYLLSHHLFYNSKKSKPLSDMSVEEFMAYNPSIEEGEGELESKEEDDSIPQKCKRYVGVSI